MAEYGFCFPLRENLAREGLILTAKADLLPHTPPRRIDVVDVHEVTVAPIAHATHRPTPDRADSAERFCVASMLAAPRSHQV